jgi:hypothetical protein
MYHLYSGIGTVTDVHDNQREIQVTLMISDMLLLNGQPVEQIPGQPLPSPQGHSYGFSISNWNITVDKIGSFCGQSGSLSLQDPNSQIPLFGMWGFKSDCSEEYSWRGEVTHTNDPDNWTNSAASGYGKLPNEITCTGPSLGSAIVHLFDNPNTPNVGMALIFVLKRL